QERMWFLWRLAPDSPAYHISWAYQTAGLDTGRLAAAVDAMVERHEGLRTTLHDHDSQIIQRIGPPPPCELIPLPPPPVRAAAAADAATDLLFDLSAGPLLRVRAWATGPDAVPARGDDPPNPPETPAHLLLFTAHHIVLDEWSLEVFERELWALYEASGDA